MSWVVLSLLSAIFLGCYEITKKYAVQGNAVAPVLLLNVSTAAVIWTLCLIACRVSPEFMSQTWLFVPVLSPPEHALLALKSLLVGASWICAFIGLKHLPLSIAAPIRATSPLWTSIVAIALLEERPDGWQGTGMIVIVIAFFLFSTVGKLEGIHFHRDRWVAFMIAATLLGSCSALYDKILLQVYDLEPATVQAWFSIYLIPVMIPWAVYWRLFQRNSHPFQWRWSIHWIAITLLAADFLYFTALRQPDALVSMISPLRRASIVIPFLASVAWMGERHWRKKAYCLLALLVGVFLIAQSH